MLVIMKQASWVCRLSKCNMLAIQCSTTIGEVPPCSKPFFNIFPILFCWGRHEFLYKCIPNDLTYLWHNEADSTWWQSESTSKCMLQIAWSQKSEILEKWDIISDCSTCHVLLYLALYSFASVYHMVMLSQCQPDFGCHFRSTSQNSKFMFQMLKSWQIRIQKAKIIGTKNLLRLYHHLMMTKLSWKVP